VCGLDIDPFNGERFLAGWVKGCWVCFEGTKELRVIGSAEGLQYSFGGGCFVENPAGHFVTGDGNTGTFRFWNPSRGVAVSAFEINSCGVTDLVRISDDRIACALMNGTLSVVSLKTRTVVFTGLNGHRTVLVGCVLASEEQRLLVTGSVDGWICTWDADTFQSRDRIADNIVDSNTMESIDVTSGGALAVCGYANGSMSVFSLGAKQKLFSVKLHQTSVCFVRFHPEDSRLFLSGSIGGTVVLYDIRERRSTFSLSLKASALEALFLDSTGDEFVVADCAGQVHFVSGDHIDSAEITDHSTAIGAICICPYDAKQLLIATSNGTLLVICREGNDILRKFTVLNCSPTAVAWNSYVQSLVIIGTLSGQIVFVDLESEAVLWRMDAHYGPVRSLHFHQSFPFLFISSSSDTCVRKWVCDKLFFKMMIAIVFEQDPQKRMVNFRPVSGAANFSRLADYLAHPDNPPMFEMDDIYPFGLASEIAGEKVELMMKTYCSANLMKRAIQKKKIVEEACRFALYGGNIQRYCELLFQYGDCDQAIAAAPAVSVDFWKELMRRKAEQQPDNSVAPLLLIGDVSPVIEQLLEIDPESAVIVASGDSAHVFDIKQHFTVIPPGRKTCSPIPRDTNAQSFLAEYAVISERAHHSLKSNDPLLMAGSYLSIGDVQSAIAILMKCGELFFALELDLLTQANHTPLRIHLAKLCMHCKVCVEYAFALLDTSTRAWLAPLIAFESVEQREHFFRSLEIQSLPDPTTLKEKIHALICGGSHSQAVSMFIEASREILQRPAWDFNEMRALVEEMELCSLDLCKRMIQREVLAISLYVAAFDAMWKGYRGILPHLHPTLQKMVDLGKIEWMKPLQSKLELLAKLTTRTDGKIMHTVQGCEEINVITHLSTAKSRRGPILYLGSEGRRMSFVNALAWFDVTAFSPYADGQVFYVF
jgi:WD40 repeat protein